MRHRSWYGSTKTALAGVAALALAVTACGVEDNGDDGGAAADGSDDEVIADHEADEDSDAYYAGRTIELVVPFGPGGGTDTTARLLAPFLNEYVEGNPSVQVVNVPGGGSINGANEFANSTERDGSQALFTANSTVLPWLLGLDTVDYDLATLEPIVGFPSSRVIYASPETGIESFEDLVDPPTQLTMAGRQPTAAELLNILALEALGMGIRDNVQEIWGYDGSGDVALAFETGEVNLGSGTSAAYLESVVPLVDEGEAFPLFTYGVPIDGGEDVGPDPAVPDVPTIKDAYIELHGEEPSGDAWDAFMTYLAVVGESTFGMWLHDDAPPEAVEALRDGIAAAAETEEFQELRDAEIGPYEPVLGDDADAYAETLRTLDQENLEYVRDLLRTEYDVDEFAD